MRHTTAFLLIPLFCLTLCAGEKKNRGPAGMKRGLAAHLFKDPEAWGGNWKEDAPPTVDPLAWTFRTYEATGIAPHINYHFIQRGWFSARLVGYLQIPPGLSGQKKEGDKETYEFMLELWADDGVRLFLDGDKVIDDWRHCPENARDAHRRVRVHLKAGGAHRIVVEYFQGLSLKKKDPDPLKMYWTCPDLHIARQLVPASHFFHKDADLSDYVPSQGLSPADAKKLDGGKAEPNVVKSNVLHSRTKR